MKVHVLRQDQSKYKIVDASLGRNLIIQLPDRTAAKIPGILILFFRRQRFVDPREFAVGNDGFPAQDQFSLVRNLQRNIAKYLCVGGDILPHLPVSPGDSPDERSLIVL